jgi:hypothetical protein
MIPKRISDPGDDRGGMFEEDIFSDDEATIVFPEEVVKAGKRPLEEVNYFSLAAASWERPEPEAAGEEEDDWGQHEWFSNGDDGREEEEEEWNTPQRRLPGAENPPDDPPELDSDSEPPTRYHFPLKAEDWGKMTSFEDVLGWIEEGAAAQENQETPPAQTPPNGERNKRDDEGNRLFIDGYRPVFNKVTLLLRFSDQRLFPHRRPHPAGR